MKNKVNNPIKITPKEERESSVYLWMKRVISSCTNKDQLIACSKLTSHYLKLYPNNIEGYIKLQKQIENTRF